MPESERGEAAPRPALLADLEGVRAAFARPSDITAEADALLSLLKPSRTSFLHWWRGRGADKDVRQVHHEVTTDVVAQHLSPVSHNGPGSLGFFLEQRGPAGFETSTLALDLDRYNPGALRVLVDTLQSLGVRVYTTRGSSGRGHHLYVFLDAPIPLSDAHAALRTLAAMAVDAGYDKVEIRPSNGHKRGIGLLAPYRGAADNGVGFNPLLDPLASDAPIPLGQVSNIERNRPDILLALAAPGRSPLFADNTSANVTIALPEDTAKRRWHDELKRVRPHWTHGKRQDLTMGLAAFGSRGLKLDLETVKSDLLQLAAEQNDEELDRRKEAIGHTFANYSAGHLVAWREYYTRAGLEPPRTSSGRPLPAALTLFHLTAVARGPWPGRTGLTNMVMYAALVRRGLEHGRLAQGKLLVSVAVRDLQIDANMSASTRDAVLKRLKARELIARVDGRQKEPTHAGAFVLKIPSNLGLPEDGETEADTYLLERFLNIVLHPAFRERALSRSTGYLLAHLTLTVSRSPEELALATGLSSETVRKGVDKLLAHELIETLPSGLLRARKDIPARLEEVADRVGATARRREQEADVEREREAFHQLRPDLKTRRKRRGQA